ncbi:MAG: UbiA family prenyltransferase [Phycisphaeraceae bacterium]|nr:UbiA family prenyltransferase [Phycisphaeraceae bacterium]QYK49581.1 MAG: UbiA family prenyltransferase [Phycisphaeraceae bacterium]
MRTLLSSVSPVLRLTRVTSGFAAIGNVWFVVLWSRANGEETGGVSVRHEPLWLLLLGGAAAAVGLYAFGAALNDLVDLRRDKVLKPERPMAAGRISPALGIAIVAASLAAALLGSTAFGTSAVILTLGLTIVVLVYTLAARFVPGVGLVVLGLVYAGHMLVPNIGLRFLWPVWVVMTHALCVAAVAHVVGKKVPALSRRAVIAVGAGWLFWTAALAWWAARRNNGSVWPDWVEPGSLGWVVPVAAAFGVFVWTRLRRPGVPARQAERVVRYGTLWMPLYGAAWLFGDGSTHAASSAWLLVGVAGVSLVGMTVLRELYGLAEQPIGYRR